MRAALAEDPQRWPGAVQELLRLVTPNQFIRRRALVDSSIDGREVRAGQAVLLIPAAANRDPQRFPDLDSFVFDRPEARDVALGLGPHYCIGVRWPGSRAGSPCSSCSRSTRE